MLGELVSALKITVLRPQVWLVCLAILVLQTAIFWGFAPAFDSIFAGQSVSQNVSELAAAYPLELLAVAVAIFAGLFLEILLFGALARVERNFSEKKGALEGIFGAKKSLANAFFGAVFCLVLAILWLFAAFAVNGIVGLNSFFGGIVFAVFAFGSAYVFLRLNFFATAMGAKELNLKESFKESWRFTGKGLWGKLVFLFIMWVVSGIIVSFGAVFWWLEDFALVPGAVFGAIGMAFLGIGFGAYFVGSAEAKASQQEKPVRRIERKRRWAGK